MTIFSTALLVTHVNVSIQGEVRCLATNRPKDLLVKVLTCEGGRVLRLGLVKLFQALEEVDGFVVLAKLLPLLALALQEFKLLWLL